MQLTQDRTCRVYYPHTQVIPDNATAKALNRAHSITANVEIPGGGAEGVLISRRGDACEWALFMDGGRLHFVHGRAGAEQLHVASAKNVPTGRVALRLEIDGAGRLDSLDPVEARGVLARVRLTFNGEPAGRGDIPTTAPLALNMGEGVCVGRDPGPPVTSPYAPPFAFTGWILSVTVDVSGKRIKDTEEELQALARAQMARQ